MNWMLFLYNLLLKAKEAKQKIIGAHTLIINFLILKCQKWFLNKNRNPKDEIRKRRLLKLNYDLLNTLEELGLCQTIEKLSIYLGCLWFIVRKDLCYIRKNYRQLSPRSFWLRRTICLSLVYPFLHQIVFRNKKVVLYNNFTQKSNG